jgi:hypothetical protein
MSDGSVRRMKTIPLRTLLRDPKSVKKMTRSGHAVRITDGGAALWDLTAPVMHSEKGSESREVLWEQHFEDLLGGGKTPDGMPSLDQVLEFSRGVR